MQSFDYGFNEPNGYNGNSQFDYFALEHKKKKERKEIRRLGFFSGLAILAMILIQNVVVLGLTVFGVYDKIMSDPISQLGTEMFISMISLLIPFTLSGYAMKKISGTTEPLPLEKPNDTLQMLLAIPAGLGFCMIANRITTYILIFMEAFGFELSSPEIPNATGTFGIIASFFRVSIVAAIAEELSLRGFTMQNLRKYGDMFAIVMSSMVFGLMHCNLVQAPFAMIVGIALGYFSVKTNTLWTGIIIHSLNNTISLALSYLSDNMSKELLAVVYTFVVIFLILFGLLCFVVFVRRQRQIQQGLSAEKTANGFAAKTAAFLSSPTMIIAIILMLYLTSKFVVMK